MEVDLFILTARIEQAWASHCKAADVQDLLEEVEDAENYYTDQHRGAQPHTRAWRRACFVREHLAKYKARLEDRLRELSKIETEQAEHQAFLDRRAKADYKRTGPLVSSGFGDAVAAGMRAQQQIAGK
jgi:hypothetical protein